MNYFLEYPSLNYLRKYVNMAFYSQSCFLKLMKTLYQVVSFNFELEDIVNLKKE